MGDSTGFLIGLNFELEAADAEANDRAEPLRDQPGLGEKVSCGSKRCFALSAEQKLLSARCRAMEL